MTYHQKHLSACLIALVALFSTASIQGAWAATVPPLGVESSFSVLGRTDVTCTTSTVVGDVGSAGTFTNTGCTISGAMPPATTPKVAAALAALVSDYSALKGLSCTGSHLTTAQFTSPNTSLTLGPGVYCTDDLTALASTGFVLTLDANYDPTAFWVFQIGAAFTGTNFTVTMINGGLPCNVYWVPSGGVTMTDSALKGNILAGAAATAADPGSITLTRGTLDGRALANAAVTMTNADVIGCSGLGTPSSSPSCTDTDGDGHDKGNGHDKDGHDKDGHDKDGHDKDNNSHANPFSKK
jgi:hypothetical protein